MATSGVASAQGFGGPGAGGFPPPAPAPQAPQKKPAGPETHAAPGADEEQAPKQEATLPEDPLAIPPEVKKRIGSDDVPDDSPKGRGQKTERDWYGLYFQEKSGDYRFRTVFPFWFERNQPNDRASFFGPYYNRRGKDHDADVVFPVFFRIRDFATTLTMFGPFGHQETDGTKKGPDGKKAVGGHANWLAPLFFEGGDDKGNGFLHIPPLLTFTHHTAKSGLNVVGPVYCSWKGGPACDPRSADEIDLGVVPFYFWGKTPSSEYEIIPPLLHYYKYSEAGDSYVNWWGPYWRERQKDGTEVLNLLPFFYRHWNKNEDNITVFPLFHYGYKGAASLLITPLFVNRVADDGAKTFVTWGYARHRGRTELDMVTPLFWRYRDPSIDLTRTFLFPFYYRGTSPRSDDLVVFPFYGRFQRHGISDTTFVTPLFMHERSITGWETDLFPVFFMGRKHKSTHFVVAPFVWDFATPRSRTTVILPAVFRFEDDQGVNQLVLNTYYQEKKVKGGREWEFHFFPLFSYGESPQGHWWNVLYGLAGFTREGTMTKMRALYIPIELSK
jgi:hypothetical protein